MRHVLTMISMFLPMTAWADGFAVSDLQTLNLDKVQFADGTYEITAEQDRIIAACKSCDDFTLIELKLGQSTDGTEGRFRSGETTIEDMRELCQQRDPDCELTGLDVGGAVGWLTRYTQGSIAGSTAVLFQDGDMLTIRAISEHEERTKGNMDAALSNIAPQIIGGG